MTSRGWSVRSAAQSRNEERNPCGTAAMPSSRSTIGSVESAIGFPLRIGNTRSLLSPSVRAASRISTARPHSGTRCSRFAFIRVAGTVHNPCGRVHLVPGRQTYLRRPRRREHQQLERQFDGRRRRGCPHRLNGRGHIPVGQRPPVRHDVALGTENRQDAVARIVRPKLHGHGPFQDGPDSLAHGPGRLRLHVPYGREDLQHVRAVDLRYRPLPDAREGVALKAAAPVLRVPPAAPAALLLLDDAAGGFGKRGNALDTPLVGQRVAALAGQPAVVERLLARLGQRYEPDGAQSQLAAASADDESLDPAPGAGRLYVEVQPVPVGVASRRRGADEGGGEGLVGVSASALGSAGFSGGFAHNIHSNIICRNGAYQAGPTKLAPDSKTRSK